MITVVIWFRSTVRTASAEGLEELYKDIAAYRLRVASIGERTGIEVLSVQEKAFTYEARNPTERLALYLIGLEIEAQGSEIAQYTLANGFQGATLFPLVLLHHGLEDHTMQGLEGVLDLEL